jgi:sortase A
VPIEASVPEAAAPAPAPATAPARERGPLFVTGVVVWVLGALVLSFVGYLAGLSRLTENHDQSVLFDKLRYELAHGTAPTTGPIASGTALATLTIPALHLRHVVVVQGSSSTDLMSGPGHLPGTSLPGQTGTSVVLGRRETFGSPFHGLSRLRTGDVITVASGSGQLAYRVDSRWRSDVAHPAPPASRSRLTLVTSDPAWRPSRSLVVSAALSSGTPGTAPVATIAAGHDEPLATDHGTALSLLLWSQLTFAAVIALLLFSGRVHRSVLWVAGLPFLAVVLLHVYPDLAALLPNTL